MKKYTTKNVDVTWNYDFQKQIREGFSNQEWANEVNKQAVPKILGMIDRGVSPVQGKRMFPKYKDPDKYPGGLKPSNKPNLKLDGTMLSFYMASPHSEIMSISIGIDKKTTPEKEIIKAIANNQGILNSSGEVAIAARRFIPLKNESFTTSIVLEIRKLFATILSKAINKRR